LDDWNGCLCNYFNKPWLTSLAEPWNRKSAQEIEAVHPNDVQGCFDDSCPHSMLESLQDALSAQAADEEYRW